MATAPFARNRHCPDRGLFLEHPIPPRGLSLTEKEPRVQFNNRLQELLGPQDGLAVLAGCSAAPSFDNQERLRFIAFQRAFCSSLAGCSR